MSRSSCSAQGPAPTWPRLTRGTSNLSRTSCLPPSDVELSPDDLALVGGLVAIPSVSRQEGDAVEWLGARVREGRVRAPGDQAGGRGGGEGGRAGAPGAA